MNYLIFCIVMWLYCVQKLLINHILTHDLKLNINVIIKTDRNVKVIFYKYFIVKMSKLKNNYMSYKINLIGNLIYFVEFTARCNKVKTILNNGIILT